MAKKEAEKKKEKEVKESQAEKKTAPKAAKKLEKKTIVKEKKELKKPKKTSTRTKPKLKKSETKHSKKYREVEVLIEKGMEYGIDEAFSLAKKTSTTKFDSSVEIHVRLGIDTKKTEQQVRGVVVLPHGTGKKRKVCAICGPQQEKEAKSAGADTVGGEDIIQKIEKGWVDFDVLVATPEFMPKLTKVAKILGPRGLMPNPKAGTVTEEPQKAVEKLKSGGIRFKTEAQAPLIHLTIGKVSFAEKDLEENLKSLILAIGLTKIKKLTLSSTMGPGITVDLTTV